MSQKLTAKNFEDAALKLDCPVAAVRTVAEIESSGSGFLPNGRPVVNFEPFTMYRCKYPGV